MGPGNIKPTMDFTRDEVIEVNKHDLEYNLEIPVDHFWYLWGWPGPDANQYFFSDYGRTWAFSADDFGKDDRQ